MIGRSLLGGMLAVAAVLMTGAFAAAADDDRTQYLYQWTDDRGNAHIADSLEKVPPRYRGRARAIEQGAPAGSPQAADPDARTSPVPDSSADMERDRQEQAEELRKMEWQTRLVNAKRRLASLEERHLQLELKLNELKGSYGSGIGIVTLPPEQPGGPPRQVPSGAPGAPQEVLDQIQQLEQDLERTRLEIENARREVEVVIPDEARKAEVPPGWLREVE
jgi:hypothetical protein